MAHTNDKKRIRYIDVMKGMLILCVIWHHIYTTRIEVGIENDVFSFFSHWRQFYNASFMPAFFFITGYCSNFEKQFKPFIKQNIKTLLLPAILLGTICEVLTTGTFSIAKFTKSIVFYGCANWFLGSLFFAKLVVYYPLSKKKYKWGLSSGLILLICATIIDDYDLVPNFWYIRHTLTFTLFLVLGNYIKSITIPRLVYKVALIVYLISIVLGYQYLSSIPYVTASYEVDIIQLPIFLWLSVTGILGWIEISRCVSENAILEYLGKNSLVIYIVHILFITYLERLLYPVLHLNESTFVSLLLYISIYATTCMLCVACNNLVNSKYLKWTIGR